MTDPRSLLIEELDRSRAIVARGFDVIPRFRILTPEGAYSILVQMRDDPEDRLRRLKLVASFMAWKMATAFLVAGENDQPNGIFCFAIARNFVEGAYRMIQRNHTGAATFGSIETLSREQCDHVFIAMLPTERSEIRAETLAQLEEAFGVGGEMEARPIN